MSILSYEFGSPKVARETLFNSSVWYRYQRWVIAHLPPTVSEADIPWVEVQTSNKDLTYGDAVERTLGGRIVGIPPLEIPDEETYAEYTWETAMKQAREVKEALEAGIITPKEAELYRREPRDAEELSRLRKKLKELERQLEVKAPPPEAKPRVLSQEQINGLKNFIRARLVAMGVSPDEHMPELERVINPTISYERNISAIIEEIDLLRQRIVPRKIEALPPRAEFRETVFEAKVEFERKKRGIPPLSDTERRLLRIPLFEQTHRNARVFALLPEEREAIGYRRNWHDLAKFYIERGMLTERELSDVGLSLERLRGAE